jgi:hypothetical protein
MQLCVLSLDRHAGWPTIIRGVVYFWGLSLLLPECWVTTGSSPADDPVQGSSIQHVQVVNRLMMHVLIFFDH